MNFRDKQTEIFEKIKSEIQKFKQKKWDLKSLLKLTEDLEQFIENIDEQYKEKVRTQWWELELTTSLMINNDQKILTEEDHQVVNEALESIVQISDEAIQTH